MGGGKYREVATHRIDIHQLNHMHLRRRCMSKGEKTE